MTDAFSELLEAKLQKPTFRYIDASRDATAAERSSVGPETRGALEALAYTRLGHVGALHESGKIVLICEIWCSADGSVLAAAEQFRGRQRVAFVTLLESGDFVTTEQAWPGLEWWLLAHGVRRNPAWGHHWFWVRDGGVASNERKHRANVAELERAANTRPVTRGDMLTYLATRLRSREIGDLMHAVCEAVDERAMSWLAGLVCSSLAVGAYLAYQRQTWLPLLAPVLCFVLSPYLSSAWRLLYGPIRARRLPIRRLPAELLFERARTVAFADLPPVDSNATRSCAGGCS